MREQLLLLLRRQPEIDHRQRTVAFVVEILRRPVFLHAESDVLPFDVEIRLEYPVVPIRPPPLKKKGMRPSAPLSIFDLVPLAAIDQPVDQRRPTHDPNPPRPGMLLEKLAVGEPL